jgi:uracil-DNA glycosylase
MRLPDDWRAALGAELEKPYFESLRRFVADERARGPVHPPEDEVFAAFEHTPLARVRVLLLGQDPYHDDGQAHGLCFSVKPGVRRPPSLHNMLLELRDDLGVPLGEGGTLTSWADQGVLMLNAVLTVRAHEANSHKDRGWETFTDAVISTVNAKATPVVFVLWGGYAKKKARLIDRARHTILESAHPSPLSARSGFFGSRPYSKINEALTRSGTAPIDWQLSR